MDDLRPMPTRATLKSLVEEYEKGVIEQALRAANWNQRRAARALGVLPTTLHEKMKRFGMLRRTEVAASYEPIALAG
jgi:two-component system response regulator HydG